MFYCGIDVAKRKHAVVILDERGKVYKPVFVVENTRAGMQFLLEQLKPFGQDVRIGLEATGHYWLSLYDVLTREGYEVVVLNPLQISAFRKSGVRLSVRSNLLSPLGEGLRPSRNGRPNVSIRANY